jgi:hypothetical protein
LKIARSAPECSPADWADRALPALLASGKGSKADRADRIGNIDGFFNATCEDSAFGSTPIDANSEDLESVTVAPELVDGMELRVIRATPAGASGRRWSGNRCEFEIKLADGSGIPVALGREQVPPFNTIRAIVRSGSAAWLSVGFNGYTREFPAGGNRIVAVDLCQGKVIWQSKDAMSNGGLLLLGDYLIAPYGFTSERRYVYVLDAHSGKVIQKLGVVENVCPSKSWAPNWHPGERCDAPGQVVGAATGPRVEDGYFYVDTNTGSARFHFR